MVSFQFIASLALAAVATATPVALVKRQSGSWSCGGNTFSSSQINSAVQEGCALHFSGDTVGSNDYPHTFNNREGLPLDGSGPYQEFPILTSGVYDGGKLDKWLLEVKS